jgi:hypothetical protein
MQVSGGNDLDGQEGYYGYRDGDGEAVGTGAENRSGVFGVPEFGDTSDPNRAKVMSFLNAKRLREGKIMANINHELQIFDIGDLDCEISIRSNMRESLMKTDPNGSAREEASVNSKISNGNPGMGYWR